MHREFPPPVHTLAHMSSSLNDLPAPFSSPSELAGDPARQAVASIRGILYQIWWSIDAWLRLRSLDEFISLEGAEDLDRIVSSGAIAGQVKQEAEGLSLSAYWQICELPTGIQSESTDLNARCRPEIALCNRGRP